MTSWKYEKSRFWSTTGMASRRLRKVGTRLLDLSAMGTTSLLPWGVALHVWRSPCHTADVGSAQEQLAAERCPMPSCEGTSQRSMQQCSHWPVDWSEVWH